MKVGHGTLLLATAVLHEVVGLAVYRRELAEMLRGGMWNTVPSDVSPAAATLWFFGFGLAGMLLGALVRYVERETTAPLPAWFGWLLGGLAVVLVVPMPATGAWLLFPQAFWIVRSARARG